MTAQATQGERKRVTTAICRWIKVRGTYQKYLTTSRTCQLLGLKLCVLSFEGIASICPLPHNELVAYSKGGHKSYLPYCRIEAVPATRLVVIAVKE